MHRLYALHAQAIAGVEGPAPLPPSPFLQAWIGAAIARVDEARATRVVEHYGRVCPEDWLQRFYGSPPAVQELVRLDLRTARVPRLRAALARLFEGARRAGVGELFGCRTVAELLDRAPRIIELHPLAFFGCCQPMVSLGPPEQAAIARQADEGWRLDELLDLRLAGHVVHELAHGAARGWTGGPTSWLVLEAAAAVVNLGCQPAHVLAERPGEPVLGLRQALVLGRAMADAVGEAAVWRFSLVGEEAASLLGARAAEALTAVERGLWLRSGAAAFVPTHTRIVSWAKLLDVARAGLLPDGDPEALLDAADAVPWSALPASGDPAAVGEALAALSQVERLQPDLQVCPSDPPDGRLVLDVEACALLCGPRRDDAHGLPTAWRAPPSLCRALAAQGLTRVELRGVTVEARRAAVDGLLRLAAEGGDGLLELRPDAPERTAVRVDPSDRQLHHTDAVVALGSCFATHIGARLAESGFEVHDSPLGILYDPLSVARALELVAGAPLPDDLLFFAHGRWHSPWHHTDLSHPERAVAWAEMTRRLAAAQAARARGWLLTWGTAWVWEDAGGVVANCHGLPAERYRRRLLGVEEIVARWAPLVAGLDAVILTVSPIRHARTGLVENQRSKATLHLAAQLLAERCPQVRYFPAYEIVIDELRDYRWFGADLVHLSEPAIEVVWERFLGAFVAPASRALARGLRAAGRALVAAPHDPVRRLRALDALSGQLDALPTAPALPRPTQLRAAVAAQRAAAEQLLGVAVSAARVAGEAVDGPARAAGGALRVAPVAREVVDGPARPAAERVLAPAPGEPEDQVVLPISAEDPIARALAGLQRALRPGVFVDWDELAAWAADVRAAVETLAALRAHQAAWRAMEALLAKAGELADPNEALPPLTEPLLAAIFGTEGRPDAVQALYELLRTQVPRGLLDARAETLVLARPADLRALAGLLSAEHERRRREGGRPPARLSELLERVRAAAWP